jgi:hypothetical protein
MGPAMERIAGVFSIYFTPQHTVSLLEACLVNLAHPAAHVRRTASACIGV